MNDTVNHPQHYTQGSIECIDYITDKGMNYCEGNIIKYVTRYKEKNGLQDLFKAQWYLNRLINDVTLAEGIEDPPEVELCDCQLGGCFLCDHPERGLCVGAGPIATALADVKRINGAIPLPAPTEITPVEIISVFDQLREIEEAVVRQHVQAVAELIDAEIMRTVPPALTNREIAEKIAMPGYEREVEEMLDMAAEKAATRESGEDDEYCLGDYHRAGFGKPWLYE